MNVAVDAMGGDHAPEMVVQGAVEVVSCNRLPLKDSEVISKIRRLGIHILNIEIALLYGFQIKDTLTGMGKILMVVVNAPGTIGDLVTGTLDDMGVSPTIIVPLRILITAIFMGNSNLHHNFRFP